MSDPRPSSASGTANGGEPEVRGVPTADRDDLLDVTDLLPDNLADLAAAEGPADRSEPVPVAARNTQESEDSDTDPVTPSEQGQPTPTIWEQMGGPMGMIDSGLPVVVFIVGNAIGGLGWGIGAALAAAVVIAILRIARKRPITQAVAGVFGVGIAAFIAYRTGSAKGYFLLGIWSYLLYGGALLVSMVIRWPLIGVIWEGINGRGTAWRKNRALVRRYDYATFVWVVVFAARYLVQNYFYDSDQVGWLAAVRLLMGYPVFILAIAISVWIVAGGSAVRLPDAWTRRGRTATTAPPPADR